MADDTLQLPSGYEDAKPVKPQAQAQGGIQLPPGYEDAKPVKPITSSTPTPASKPAPQAPTPEQEDQGTFDRVANKVMAVGSGLKRGRDYATGGDSAPPQNSSAKSTLTLPGAPAPVTFQDKNATGMQKMSYLDPSSAGQSVNAGKLQGLPGVDPVVPRFREGMGDVMTAAAPLMVPAAVAAPGVTAGGLVGGTIGSKVGGKVGGTVAETLHEGAGPTGEDIGSTVGMLAGAHRGAVKAEELGRVPDNVRTPLSDLTDEQKQADANVDALKKDLDVKQKNYDKAKAKDDQHAASHAEGILSPKPVANALEKAKAELKEAQYHHTTAVDAAAKARAVTPTAKPAPQPEVPTEQIEAMPRPGTALAPKPGVPELPVEKPAPGTEPTPDWKNRPPLTQPDQPEAAATQYPEFPMVRPGEAPAAPQAEAKAAPKAEAPAPKPAGMRDMNKLKVNEKGDVIDTSKPQDRLHELLNRSLEPEAPKPAPVTAKEAPAPVKETPKAEEAPKEPVMTRTEEGRAEPKSAAEYHPAVQEQVGALSDEKLKQLAKAHGLNPDEYDFKARDEGRHRTERDQLAKEITEQMGDDEKANIGRNAERLNTEGTFQNKDMTGKSKAERAESLFPRLRGPVDENGNPKVGGGAPDEEENAKKATGYSLKADKRYPATSSVGTVEAQAKAHNENGGSTFHPEKGDLNGTKHFAVGGEPEFRDPKLKLTTDGKYMTAAQIKEFSERPEVKAALDKHKDASVGTWYDKDTDKTITELVKTPTDRAEAIAMGQKNGEKAIYDLGKGEEIKTERRANERKAPLNAKETEDAMAKRKPFQNAFDVTEGANATIAADKNMPKSPAEEAKAAAKGKADNYHGEPMTYEHSPMGEQGGNQQHHVITKDANGRKIGELVAQDTKSGVATVRSNQIYDEDLQGKGRGTDQITHFLNNVGKDIHTVHSDISTSKPARGAWDKLEKAYPDSVTKKTYKDQQTRYTVDMEKYQEEKQK
jgi:hypothetical protein